MKLYRKQIVLYLEYVILGSLLLFLMYWHFRVGLARFFDVDEFTHLHWAANIARGEKPYLDFFTFFTPGFYWFLAPLFWIFGKSIALFTAARVVAFCIFAGMIALTGWLFRLTRSRRFFLLPLVILAFLPMPFDKYMEVRPDNLSTLFGLAGVFLQIIALKFATHPKIRTFWFLSAISYATSMIVLVKSLPFVAMGVFIWMLDAQIYPWILSSLSKRKVVKFVWPADSVWFVYGLGGVCLLFGIWLIALGDITTVVYSLTKMPFEANTIGRIYIMEPHLFFFPNASFYGGWGMTPAFLVNHLFWTIGLLMGVYRMFTPFITADGERKDVLAEALISGIFMVSVFGYVQFFPMKHSQYLIPIAIFVAFYCADFLSLLLRRLGWISPAALLLLALCVANMTVTVNSPKLLMNSTVQMQQVELLRAKIGDKQVLDLDGRAFFSRDPYEICCLPFGTFTRFLSRPPESLSAVLERKKVPYIYQGDSGRFWELTADMPYIRETYERVPGWGDALWVRKQL